MSKNITKAKLKDRSLTVDFTEEKVFVNPEGETIQSAREVTCKCDDLCHDSLVYAFDQLKPHAALIGDLRDAIKVENAIAEGKSIYEIDLDELASISITGFVVTGSDEDGSKAAMIICQKKSGTRVLNITTPAVKFEDPDYTFCTELGEVIDSCIAEVEDYLDGKVAVKQLEMNFDEGFEGDPAVAEPKAKRGRKKKLVEGFDASIDESGIVLTLEEKVA